MEPCVSCIHCVFISPIVWNMYENLHYESVYFKELQNESEYHWPTIYRTGAAVVSTITSLQHIYNTGSPSSKYDHRRASAQLRNIRNVRICMGKKPIFSVSYEWNAFNKKNSLPYIKCVTSFLCGPWADLRSFYGLYCKRFSLRDGPLEKWWEGEGGGGGEFSACTNFCFRSLLVQEFFFQVNPSVRFFFFRQILLFFWTVKSWFIIYVFVLYELFYIHNRSKDTGHFNANLFENVHTVREEEATSSGRLPCAFFQSLPSGISLPQPIIMMPYSIHQWKPYFVVLNFC